MREERKKIEELKYNRFGTRLFPRCIPDPDGTYRRPLQKKAPADKKVINDDRDPGDECTNTKKHSRKHSDECTNTHTLRSKL